MSVNMQEEYWDYPIPSDCALNLNGHLGFVYDVRPLWVNASTYVVGVNAKFSIMRSKQQQFDLVYVKWKIPLK